MVTSLFVILRASTSNHSHIKMRAPNVDRDGEGNPVQVVYGLVRTLKVLAYLTLFNVMSEPLIATASEMMGICWKQSAVSATARSRANDAVQREPVGRCGEEGNSRH
jgi:hypothetical protein